MLLTHNYLRAASLLRKLLRTAVEIPPAQTGVGNIESQNLAKAKAIAVSLKLKDFPLFLAA
jgi:hypothetical protein